MIIDRDGGTLGRAGPRHCSTGWSNDRRMIVEPLPWEGPGRHRETKAGPPSEPPPGIRSLRGAELARCALVWLRRLVFRLPDIHVRGELRTPLSGALRHGITRPTLRTGRNNNTTLFCADRLPWVKKKKTVRVAHRPLQTGRFTSPRVGRRGIALSDEPGRFNRRSISIPWTIWLQLPAGWGSTGSGWMAPPPDLE